MPTIPPIVLATHNRNKVQELQTMLSDQYQVMTMGDVGFHEEIAETSETFVGNAILKAVAVYDFLQQRKRKYIVVAEDSGLCVEALGGRPGVYTARYGGKDCNDSEKRQKLLAELEGEEHRAAQFVCALACLPADSNKLVYFTGETQGKITTEERGEHGFAFDKVFYSDVLGKTFAEATQAEKDSVSHRGDAIRQLREYLEKHFSDA